MYATIRRYRAENDMDEALRRADAGYAAALEQQVGFVEYQIVRTGPGEIISVLLFQTQDEADRNRFFAEEFVNIGFTGLDIEVADEWRGEVQVSSASGLVLERLRAVDEAGGGSG